MLICSHNFNSGQPEQMDRGKANMKGWTLHVFLCHVQVSAVIVSTHALRWNENNAL